MSNCDVLFEGSNPFVKIQITDSIGLYIIIRYITMFRNLLQSYGGGDGGRGQGACLAIARCERFRVYTPRRGGRWNNTSQTFISWESGGV